MRAVVSCLLRQTSRRTYARLASKVVVSPSSSQSLDQPAKQEARRRSASDAKPAVEDSTVRRKESLENGVQSIGSSTLQEELSIAETDAAKAEKRPKKEQEKLAKEQKQKERQLKKELRAQAKEALKLRKQQVIQQTHPFSLRKERERVQPAVTLDRLRNFEALEHDPTLDDLQRYRPKVIRRTNSPVYAKFFTTTVQTVYRAFTGEQLEKMAKDLNIQLEPRISNRRVAQAIVQQAWGMANPLELEQQRKVVTQSLQITPRNMFLLMGQDGGRIFEWSQRFSLKLKLENSPSYSIHKLRAFAISKKEAVMYLSARGTVVNLGMFYTALEEKIKNSVSEKFKDHQWNQLPADLLPHLSRLVGAFVERVESGTRITASDKESVMDAARVMTLTANNLSLTNTPLLASISSHTSTSRSASSYTLFPFVSPQTAPYTLGTDRLFRLRQVEDFLAPLPTTEDVRHDQLWRMNGKPTDFWNFLLKDSVPSAGYQREVIASLGHIVFNRPGSRSIAPPSIGRQPFSNILTRLPLLGLNTTFIPSLPPLLPLTSMSTQRELMHRLTYRASPKSRRLDRRPLDATPFKIFEAAIPVPKPSVSHSEETHLGEDIEVPLTTSDTSVANYRIGTERVMDNLMPEQSMDLRVSARLTRPLPEDEGPVALRSYFKAWASFATEKPSINAEGQLVASTPPRPPLQFHFEGDDFVYTGGHYVGKQQEVLLQSADHSGAEHVDISSEVLEDIETKERGNACQVVCQDPSTEGSWNRFFTSVKGLISSHQQINSPPDFS